MRNMQPEEVHEAVTLVRGNPKPFFMMEGIGEGFDAAMFVGYHAMSGTENAICDHTISSGTVDAVYVNGRETGEFGINAAIAGWYGVPAVMLSGDEAACMEARDFVPKVRTAAVKTAVGRVSARCIHPKKARKLIRDVALDALTHLTEFEPHWVNEPVVIKAVWRTTTLADIVSVLPYMERVSGKATQCEFDSFPLAYRGLRAAIAVASTIR